MRESDWKLFTELKDIAIEKYFGSGRITKSDF